MSAEFILQLVLSAAAGAGIYAAIRADLTRAIITAERAEKDAGEAHQRLNLHIENHHIRTTDHGS